MSKDGKIKVQPTRHSERCPKCKEIVKRLLEKIYGKVEINFKFDIGTQPDDFKNTPYYEPIRRIYTSLQNYRNQREFVKSKTLPHCDFFIPNHHLIVEFDETQHFTEPREITLKEYPDELKLGFDRERWIELCKRIRAKDNDPPYRDEQRAWYDTLRDFLPLKVGLKPTIRLFAKDFVWCNFDPSSSSDLKKFKGILEGSL